MEGQHRLVVTPDLEHYVMAQLHLPHLGMQKTTQMARGLFWFPKMSTKIKQYIKECPKCQYWQHTPPRQPLLQTFADRAMEKLSIDVCYNLGVEYLIIVDRFSNYPWVRQLRTCNARVVARFLEEIFHEWGRPDSIRHDGANYFDSAEWKEWMHEMNIANELSAAYHPESNGHAENCVRIVKDRLHKAESMAEFWDSLAEYRSFPLSDGLSPWQWISRRNGRTGLPVLSESLDTIPDDIWNAALARKLQIRKKVKAEYDKHAKPAKQLSVGQRVRVKEWDTKVGHKSSWPYTGTIISIRPDGRSYEVAIDGAKRDIQIRDDGHLSPIPPPFWFKGEEEDEGYETNGQSDHDDDPTDGKTVDGNAPSGPTVPDTAKKKRRLRPPKGTVKPQRSSDRLRKNNQANVNCVFVKNVSFGKLAEGHYNFLPEIPPPFSWGLHSHPGKGACNDHSSFA